MENIDMFEDMYETFVSGVKQGVDSYRLDRNNSKLIRNNGMSWSKSNYIDTGFLNELKLRKNLNIIYDECTEGSWKYLVFSLLSEKTLFNFRPLRYVKNFNFSSKEKTSGHSMLDNFHINDHHFSDNDFYKENVQLSIFDDPKNLATDHRNNVENIFNNKFLNFFIIGYGINKNNELSSLKIFMPNCISHKFELIQDLTYLIPFANNIDKSTSSKIDENVSEENIKYYGLSVDKSNENDNK